MKIEEALARPGRNTENSDNVTVFKYCHSTGVTPVHWNVTAITKKVRDAGLLPGECHSRVSRGYLTLEGMEEWFDPGRIEIDKEYAISHRVNPLVPIICLQFNDGTLPIDGWNRIYKAIQLGRTEIMAYFVDGSIEHEYRYTPEISESLNNIDNNPLMVLLEKMAERKYHSGVPREQVTAELKETVRQINQGKGVVVV